MNKPQKNKGRPSTYDNHLFLKALTTIWLIANLPCSKRLKTILMLWLPGCCRSFEKFPTQVRALLGTLVYSIDAIHIATGWTEQRTVWCKGNQRP